MAALAYNKDKVKSPPTTWQQLLDSQWKGQATLAYNSNFSLATYQLYAAIGNFPPSFPLAAAMGWLLVAAVAIPLALQAAATTVYITHDQAEAFALANQVGVLERGRLVQAGTPEEIYTRPATPFVGPVRRPGRRTAGAHPRPRR